MIAGIGGGSIGNLFGASPLAGGQSMGVERPKLDFATIDADQSGGITLAEVTKSDFAAPGRADMESIFNALDADGDGEVTMAETDAFKESMQSQIEKMASMLGGGSMAGLNAGGSGSNTESLLDLLESSDEDDESEDVTDLNSLIESITSQMAEQAYQVGRSLG